MVNEARELSESQAVEALGEARARLGELGWTHERLWFVFCWEGRAYGCGTHLRLNPLFNVSAPKGARLAIVSTSTHDVAVIEFADGRLEARRLPRLLGHGAMQAIERDGGTFDVFENTSTLVASGLSESAASAMVGAR